MNKDEKGFFSTNPIEKDRFRRNFKEFLINQNLSRDDFKVRLSPNKTILMEYDPTVYGEESFYLIKNIEKLVLKEGAINLAVSLRNASWLDSASIGTLVNLRKRVKGVCCLYDVDSPLHELFEMLNLDKVVTICDDEEDATLHIDDNTPEPLQLQ